MEEKVGWGIISISVLLMTTSIYFSNKITEKRDSERNSLYQLVEFVADTNRDNITDKREWEKVYESLGLNYNEPYSYPRRDLNMRKMKKYLEIK